MILKQSVGVLFALGFICASSAICLAEDPPKTIGSATSGAGAGKSERLKNPGDYNSGQKQKLRPPGPTNRAQGSGTGEKSTTPAGQK